MSSPISAIGSLSAAGLSAGGIGASDPVAPSVVSALSVSGVGGNASTSLDAASNNGETTESANNFAATLADSLQDLQAMQAKKDDLAVKAATGNLNDVHDYTIAATEAQLATQLTVAVRDKAVAAFQEIMRMQ
ncbi:flagellar hook-basal body complex protein FliE [Cryptosporangium phraense]|uniref:Flagellar hook-basal body complex protein FliE n=1 Tax=Cryptosporangium phraense TaxID=2593070 RepID=A0A545AEI7_9ACTN|nr:flagellar hook-basal body complex protein FliE [Cryptosporangium phraense]TQS39680.1 flagellar hook-basal body complex protein FliE [Cryptosporangium phraense]